MRTRTRALARLGRCAAGFDRQAFSAILVLNEIRYDPPGPDAGGEYVELLNVSSTAVVVDAQWRLLRGNGARANDWTIFWTGDGTVLPSGAYLVIGDDPRATRAATPALQNGPDACRLDQAGTIADLVGWGALAFEEYAEGEPAPDPDGGLLARRPDGAGTGVNAADWVSAPRETPGRPNFPHRSLGLAPAFPPTDPAVPEPGEPFDVLVALEALGLDPLEARSAGVRIDPGAIVWGLDDVLPAGATRDVAVRHPSIDSGPHDLAIAAWGTDVPDSVHVRVSCGRGPAALSEIQPRPSAGEPEWIEIAIEEPGARAGTWRLVDGGHHVVTFDLAVASGVLVVLTADPAALLGRYVDIPVGAIVPVELPALNDRDETLSLVAPLGEIVDSVTFDAPADGRTLERVNVRLSSRDPASWVPAPAGATPGRVNGAHAEPKATPGLVVEPRVVGERGCEIQFHAGAGTGRLDLGVYDLEGRRLGTVLLRENAAGRGGIHWDGALEGRPLDRGLYLLVLRFDAGPTGRAIARTSFAIGGSP